MATYSVGQLFLGEILAFGDRLDDSNQFDQYNFSTPNYGSDTVSGGFGWLVNLSTLTGSVVMVLGQDLNRNGSFDSNETIGDPILFDPTTLLPGESFSFSLPRVFIDDAKAPSTQSHLQPGQDYFLQIQQSQPGTTLDYVGEAFPYIALEGEISTDDSFYCCNSSKHYYYDEFTDDLLGHEIKVGVGGLVAGDQLAVAVASDFTPVIMIFNTATGKVLDATTKIEDSSLSDFLGLGSKAPIKAQATFTLEAGISYGISVETLQADVIGSYTLSAILI